MVSSTDWDPNEPITVENKEILTNLLLYEETIVRRGKKVEAMREGLKVMGLAPFFCMDATRPLFLGAPVTLNAQIFVKLINWNTNKDVKSIVDWFHSLILTSDVDILKKLLKFCTGVSDVSSFDSNKIITLNFLQDEVLPRASACTFHLMLPLRCAHEKDFVAMMKVALNCECQGFAEF